MRLIKKYKNRRLYDTELKKTITFGDVKSYVLRNVDFKIIDNSTGEDITVSILAGIMGESANDIKGSGAKIIKVILRKGGVEAMDFMKKLTLASIGAVTLTRERAEELFDELVKKGEMTNDEKAEAVKDFVNRSVEATEQARRKTEDFFNRFAERFSNKLNEQMDQVMARLDELNARIADLERKNQGPITP